MLIGEPLFNESHLSDYLRGQADAIEPHVARTVTKADLERTDSEIIARLVKEGWINPLKVDFDHPTKDVQEARVIVSDGFSGRFEVDGVRATRAFSFTGDRKLFGLMPSRFSNAPRGEIAGDKVIIGVDGRRDDRDGLKQAIDGQEKLLRDYIQNSAAQVDAHNASLEGRITDALARRRKSLGEIDRLRDML